MGCSAALRTAHSLPADVSPSLCFRVGPTLLGIQEYCSSPQLLNLSDKPPLTWPRPSSVEPAPLELYPGANRNHYSPAGNKPRPVCLVQNHVLSQVLLLHTSKEKSGCSSPQAVKKCDGERVKCFSGDLSAQLKDRNDKARPTFQVLQLCGKYME